MPCHGRLMYTVQCTQHNRRLDDLDMWCTVLRCLVYTYMEIPNAPSRVVAHATFGIHEGAYLRLKV